jgi:hypothetical protein
MSDADTLALLKSIDASLKALVGRASAQTTSATVASDADLDGQYGDPEVKAKDPRDWTGPSMKGLRFSRCPAEYLDMVADRLDYFCSTNPGATEEDHKKLKYQRLDAARARGWAKRIRAGYKPPAAAPGWADESI